MGTMKVPMETSFLKGGTPRRRVGFETNFVIVPFELDMIQLQRQMIYYV